MKYAVAISFGLMIGCGGAAQAPVTTSAAPSAAISNDAPASSAAERAVAEAASNEPAPPGELVCRSVDSVDGTNELYLTWDGNEARGVIRNTTQSGMRHEQRVKAERADGISVVDDPHESDLATHAAVLQKQSGALMMRLSKGMSGKWVACSQGASEKK